MGVGVMGSCSELWCEWRNLMGKEGNMKWKWCVNDCVVKGRVERT